jgi:NADH-quinone oxidoreductase subunit L
MGGLRKYMPITHLTFLIACLSIAGVPPFSGFFSKEEILTAAYHSNIVIYVIALFTAGLTAFYMFRLYFSIFWNKEFHTHDESADSHHGEAPWTMKLPLLLLSLLAIAAGFVPFGDFVSSDGHALAGEFHLALAIPPVMIGLCGIILAFVMYKGQSNLPEKISTISSNLYQAAYRKFYIDEIYLFITKKVVFNLIAVPSAWIDKNIVDGAVNLSAYLTDDTSELIKGWQSGKMQQYAIWFFAGVIGLVAIFVCMWY